MPVYFPSASGNRHHIRPNGFAWPESAPKITARSYGGRVECSHAPEDLIDLSIFVQTYYVDAAGGNDANSGLSWALRKKTIGNARRAAIASGLPSRILVYAKGGETWYPRNRSFADDNAHVVSTVPMLIEAIEGRVRTGPYDDLVWSKTAGYTNVYQANRTATVRVMNPSVADAAHGGHELEYTWITGADLAAKLATLDATEGAWATDGGVVYTHCHGHEPATNRNVRVVIQSLSLSWNCNQDLFVRGFDFYGGTQGNIYIRGGSTNRVVFDDCLFRFAGNTNTYESGTVGPDAAQVLGCGLFAAYNSRFDLAAKDGANFHAEGAVIPAALLVGCKGYRNGLAPSVSNNGFTAHDGVKAISIGCDWTGSRGTNSVHVGAGTQVWSVADQAGSSAGDLPTGGTNTNAGFAVHDGAEIWLDSCCDVGAQMGVFANNGGKAYLRNHRGSGQIGGDVLRY